MAVREGVREGKTGGVGGREWVRDGDGRAWRLGVR